MFTIPYHAAVWTISDTVLGLTISWFSPCPTPYGSLQLALVLSWGWLFSISALWPHQSQLETPMWSLGWNQQSACFGSWCQHCSRAIWRCPWDIGAGDPSVIPGPQLIVWTPWSSPALAQPMLLNTIWRYFLLKKAMICHRTWVLTLNTWILMF